MDSGKYNGSLTIFVHYSPMYLIVEDTTHKLPKSFQFVNRRPPFHRNFFILSIPDRKKEPYPIKDKVLYHSYFNAGFRSRHPTIGAIGECLPFPLRMRYLGLCMCLQSVHSYSCSIFVHRSGCSGRCKRFHY